MIDSLYNILSRIGITSNQDKVLHLLVGIVVGFISHHLIIDSILVLGPMLTVAVGKELWDKYIKKTYFDFFDMFATLLGGVVGIMAYGLIA